MLMDVETLVDAALAGFDQGELVTIPSREDVDQLIALETGRLALRPQHSRQHAASRY